MNIFDVIKQETAGELQRTAIIDGQNRLSYFELFDAVGRVAAVLKRSGVSRFHRVGLLADDSIDYIIASLAILSLSAVIVPVSPEQTTQEIQQVIDSIDLDYVLAEPKLFQYDQQSMVFFDGLTDRELCLLQRHVQYTPPAAYFDTDPAFIRFSSGTTGTSKGVVLSHQAIIDRTDAADHGMQITSEDTVLWVLSMSYHFVVTILLFLRRGATIALCSRRFPETLIEGILVHKGTFIYASPFHYSLLSRTDLLTEDSMKQVRMAISTSMKLPEQIAEDFVNKFGFELSEAYGIIEVGLPFIKLAGCRDKRGSVGKALPDFQLKLQNVDENGIGEILIKGKGMLDAYYSPWQGRGDILMDGWFKTGDLGVVDNDGFLFIQGRDKDVINFAGMKIFAQEVEAVINHHPKVQESLVYGVPHSLYGELPTAKVMLKNGIADDALFNELKRFCYQSLAQYKVPKEFLAVESIPKTASGKIKRNAG